MSVSTEAEVLLMLDLNDMPALPCESISHADPRWAHMHNDGPATHYAQIRHDCVGGRKKGEIYAVCAKRAARLMWLEATGRSVRCVTCGGRFERSWDWTMIVGPIRGRKK